MRKRFHSPEDDAVLSGRLDPDDAPPELKDAVGLIRAARAPATVRELAGEDVLVAAIAAEMRRSVPAAVGVVTKRRQFSGQAISGKVIAATGIVLLSCGAAAAATDVLPASIQRAVSHGLAHVGISIPAPAIHQPTVHRGRGAKSISAAKPNSHGISSSAIGSPYGLCTAYLHHHKSSSATSTGANSSATSLSQLARAAQANGETISQYCERVLTPSTAVNTNRGSTHRPTTPTTPARSKRPTDKSTGRPTTSTPGHTHKTASPKTGRPLTNSVGKSPSRSSANNSPKIATTTTLAHTDPGAGSTGGKGASSAHSH